MTGRSVWTACYLGGLGLLVFPLLYAFTPLLSFADYRLPETAGITIFAAALLLFWRSHADLGRTCRRSWPSPVGRGSSPAGSTGVSATRCTWRTSSGRSPFLSSSGMSWPGGRCSSPSFPLALRRMPREEAMMLDHFGEEYRAYMARTGRLVPPLWK
nr:hypothetical protein [Methanofollis ethanolicus]